MTSSADDFAVKIPSETSHGRQVQERIMGLLETRSYPDRDLFGVRLALEEAIVNAIKHGNGMDPSKEVRINCSFDDDRVTIVIEDEGPGFDVTSVPDPTSEENLDKPGGRGIMLMRSFMSRVEYNDSGNRLLLEKVRGTEDE
ncbi:MAG TPA: ATP-binding protein [Planctomycetaceae bacterium]|nr:ATP-binding protein [Planctomycetaceae bacterium]HCC99995.1 ATP-binding protein [Planctomycetaceae bacterium]|tara:strand:+ start:1153 stop:1578 length:426 start_codon:yes stop_codon:yes gene_type:complete